MPITTTAQLALAERVHQQITTRPGSHHQGSYWRETDCGTTACIAGWTCIFDGLVPVVDPTFTERIAIHAARPGEEPVHMDDHARELLGLTFDEAERLFTDWSRSSAVRYLSSLIENARI